MIIVWLLHIRVQPVACQFRDERNLDASPTVCCVLVVVQMYFNQFCTLRSLSQTIDFLHNSTADPMQLLIESVCACIPHVTMINFLMDAQKLKVNA